ncbi:MAG TPA: RagB/SusD family nutrient uptake outer membrane protein [Gemmatimonadaceae bacterium]|nr:RagB/SusD family nutrient uptake outer membrane protein [Gemmatimonadaceae bacterium]
MRIPTMMLLSRRSVLSATLAACAALTALSGCKATDVTDLNNSSIQDLSGGATPAAIAAAEIGLVITSRGDRATEVNTLGIYGRESYNIQTSEPRTVTNTLIGPLVQQNGGGLMFGGYVTIREANIIMKAVDNVTALSDAQKSAVRGFTQTWKALAFLRAIEVRERLGIPLDVDVDPNSAPAAIADRDAVYTKIGQLLDSARANLATGGAAFPFTLPSGFEGFDTPATFAMFAAGLEARAHVYHGDFAAALTDLQSSFVDTTASFDLGVYYGFSNNAGDTPNPFSDATQFFAHDSDWAQAELRPDGSKDLRAQTKLVKMAQAFSYPTYNITTNYQFVVTADRETNAPISEVRNEELILLRAEANLGLDNTEAALKDINEVRVKSGGLAPLPDPYSGDMLQALLYEKRYSLLFEGHRWLDLLHYNLLATLPKAAPNHKIFDANPYPVNECVARNPQPEGCNPIAGF